MQETQETQFLPWVRKCPGGGNGSPLQYLCLKTLMDRGAWWAPVHLAAELDMTGQLSTRAHPKYTKSSSKSTSNKPTT